jgi:hypothetical protein
MGEGWGICGFVLVKLGVLDCWQKRRNREWVGKKKKEVTKLMGQQKGGLLTFTQILVDEPIFLGFNLYANIGG